MPQQILDIANADTVGQEMRRKGMAQRMGRYPFVETSPFHRFTNRLLEGYIQNMTTANSDLLT